MSPSYPFNSHMGNSLAQIHWCRYQWDGSFPGYWYVWASTYGWFVTYSLAVVDDFGNLVKVGDV